ncbi:doublesex- and mab-3-related transcription factor dmd-10-like [Chironomus tepperi]|uniref:doublesex- and mab-3-related transcription factor dmd-10-like n=1 Tax=Chironomus tepperi TaxID=113505 RepID=UPI00391EEA4F
MCRNHGLKEFTKNHKSCPNNDPEHFKTCKQCRLTNERRISISREIKILRHEAAMRNKGIQLEALSSGGQRRQQMCRKCRFHDLINPMREHKKKCPYQTCTCEKCRKVKSRCSAFNDEAKVTRKLLQTPPDQSKNSVKDGPVASESKTVSMNNQPDFEQFYQVNNVPLNNQSYSLTKNAQLPKFNMNFRPNGQVSVQSSLYDGLNFVVESNNSPDLIESLKSLKTPQFEEKLDFDDESNLYSSILEPLKPISDDSFYANPQNHYKTYADLNKTQYDIEIKSSLLKFTDDYMDIVELDYSNESNSFLQPNQIDECNFISDSEFDFNQLMHRQY